MPVQPLGRCWILPVQPLGRGFLLVPAPSLSRGRFTFTWSTHPRICLGTTLTFLHFILLQRENYPYKVQCEAVYHVKKVPYRIQPQELPSTSLKVSIDDMIVDSSEEIHSCVVHNSIERTRPSSIQFSFVVLTIVSQLSLETRKQWMKFLITPRTSSTENTITWHESSI